MPLSLWSDKQVPHVEGILCATGTIYEFAGSTLKMSSAVLDIESHLNVVILASKILSGGQFSIHCGEALEHGSIGVVVLEDAFTQAPIWSFVSDQSNPFDQIEIKGGYVLALSTSGSILRIRPVLTDVSLFIP